MGQSMTSNDIMFAGGTPVSRPTFKASARESATQVVFRIPIPISIDSGHSLIVPISDRQIPAARVSLYQPATHADHPIASARLKNDAKTGLPGGVLTLFERDGKAGGVAYLGDAQLRTLPPGESRLVGFALDEKVRVERELKHARSLTKGKIARGVFHHTIVDQRTTIYRLKGAADAARRVTVEHPRMPGWSLVKPDPKKAKVGLADKVFRISIDLKPGEERKLSVVTSRPRRQGLSLSSLRPHRVAAFAATDSLDAKVRAAFKRMAGLMAEIDGHKGDVKMLTREQKDIFNDQRRIRDNMRRVGSRSQLFQRYSRKLEKQENVLDGLTRRLEAARES